MINLRFSRTAAATVVLLMSGVSALAENPPPPQQAATQQAAPAPAGQSWRPASAPVAPSQPPVASPAQAPVPRQGQVAPLPPPPDSPQDPAFRDAESSVIGASPAQVRAFRAENDRVDRALGELPYGLPVDMRRESLIVSTDPAAPMPEIHALMRVSTTLTFLDQTGQPWPVIDVVSGYAERVDIKTLDGTNIVVVTPTNLHFSPTMMTVLLAPRRDSKQVVTVPIRIVSAYDTLPRDSAGKPMSPHTKVDVDASSQMIVQSAGPMAAIMPTGPATGSIAIDHNLPDILDGVPPAGATPVHVMGGDGSTSVWRMNGQLYVRTRAWVINPVPTSHLTSAGGVVNSFVVADRPVLLVSYKGHESTLDLAE